MIHKYKTERSIVFNATQKYVATSKSTELLICPTYQALVTIKNKKEKKYSVNDILRYKEKPNSVISLQKKKYYQFDDDNERAKFIGILRDTQLFGVICSKFYSDILFKYKQINTDTIQKMLIDNGEQSDESIVETMIKSLGNEIDFLSFFSVFRTAIANSLPAFLLLWSTSVSGVPPSGERTIEDFQRIAIIPDTFQGEFVVSYIGGVCKICDIDSHKSSLHGILVLTNFRLLFPPLGIEPDSKMALRFSIPLLDIAYYKFIKQKQLIITTKDTMTNLELYFSGYYYIHNILYNNNSSKEEIQKFIDELDKRIRIHDMTTVFAHVRSQADNKGWDLIQINEDFKRLNIFNNEKFRKIENSDFLLSPTYPKIFYVPIQVTEDIIDDVSSYRSKARIPTVIWMNLSSNVLLLRSSQPNTGIIGRKSDSDRKLLDTCRLFPLNQKSLTQSHNEDNIQLHIYDARKPIAANGNKVRGGGHESVSYYKNITYHYLSIENIHTMRESFMKLGKTLTNNTDNFFHEINDSKWLNHLSSIIKGSTEIVNTLINEECSVLIHCSDGWDRTAQLCATVEFLLDPFYRSLHGFALLIEKEFCSFGFKFLDRCAHGKKWPNSEWSPIFIQWLDVIHQIINQFEIEIEFNNNLLCFIADHIHSCLFGNFLYNCEREKAETNVENTTLSIWSYVFDKQQYYIYSIIFNSIKDFLNPNYKPHEKILYPHFIPSSMDVWKSCYMKYVLYN